jgi:hypothetical protein
MPKIYLYEYKSTDKILTDGAGNLANAAQELKDNPHWFDLRTKAGDRVFVFGGVYENNGNLTATENLDNQNIALVKREFKLLNLEKKNKMVDTQVFNINNKKGAQHNRTTGIVDLNTHIVKDFLKYLDRMYWENKALGIRSTIDFDDAFELVKPIFQDLLNISATIIDDNYNNTITDKEIEDAVERSKLKQEQITSDGVIKKSKKNN